MNPITMGAWAARAAERWGIFFVMLCFFIWWTYTNNQQLVARLEKQEEFIHNALTSAIERNNEAMLSVRTALQRFIDRTESDNK